MSAPCTTQVGGLATATGHQLTQSVLRPRLDDFLLVSHDAIDEAAALMMSRAHTLAEGAGAASLAGLLVDPARPENSAVVCTGGNASPEEITRIARLVGG